MERGVATLDIKIAVTVTPRGETVPGKRMSMRKTREVLRLYFELKLRQRQIARSANVSQSTVHEYVERFRAAGLSWPLPAKCRSRRWKSSYFPPTPASRGRWSRPHLISPTSISNCKGTSTPPCSCCGEEYRAGHADGYGYSRFCHHYQRFKQERDLVLRQCHRPGEKLFVDWAGATMPLYDPATASHAPRSCSWRCWRQQLHLCRGYAGSADGELDRSPRAGVGVFRRLPGKEVTDRTITYRKRGDKEKR